VSEHRQEVEGESEPAHTNGVREISKTTRFYVPSASPSSEDPQATKTSTDAGQAEKLSPKLYIPEVFSSRSVCSV